MKPKTKANLAILIYSVIAIIIIIYLTFIVGI
jgi:hypothetical protein